MAVNDSAPGSKCCCETRMGEADQRRRGIFGSRDITSRIDAMRPTPTAKLTHLSSTVDPNTTFSSRSSISNTSSLSAGW